MDLTKDELTRQVGAKIRELRLSRNKTIEDMALEAEMEYTQLSRIERGKINTGVYHLYKISRSLGLMLHEILWELPRISQEKGRKKGTKARKTK
jgi:transcriptional regulator with XRE-family HTH domain